MRDIVAGIRLVQRLYLPKSSRILIDGTLRVSLASGSNLGRTRRARQGAIGRSIVRIQSDFSNIFGRCRREQRPDQPSRLILSSVTTRSTFSVLLLMR